jgi:hypothetical protein
LCQDSSKETLQPSGNGLIIKSEFNFDKENVEDEYRSRFIHEENLD